MTPQSCREELPRMGGSSWLPLLSKAGKPWPGTCVCCRPTVSLSLLCLALTLGTCMGSGSPPAVWHSRVAGTSVCECCSACPSAHGEGCGRGRLHHLWGPGKAWGLLSLAGSLTLPHLPTHSSCPCGNSSRTGEGAVELCQGGLSCLYILGPTPSLQGGEKGNIWA